MVRIRIHPTVQMRKISLFHQFWGKVENFYFYTENVTSFLHDGRLLELFLPQLRKFHFLLTEQYFIFQMKQDIKTS